MVEYLICQYSTCVRVRIMLSITIQDKLHSSNILAYILTNLLIQHKNVQGTENDVIICGGGYDV